MFPSQNPPPSQCVNYRADWFSHPQSPRSRVRGPLEGPQKAQPRRLFSPGPAYRQAQRYQKRPFSSQSAWLRTALQRGDARFSPSLSEGRASWLRGCQAEESPGHPSLPQMARKGSWTKGRLQGA